MKGKIYFRGENLNRRFRNVDAGPGIRRTLGCINKEQ
jgi:hypothetical protein